MIRNKINHCYDTKPADYFVNARHDVLKMIPSPVERILEIGCGAGCTLSSARKTGLAKHVHGIDIVDFGQGKILDVFQCRDIEKDGLGVDNEQFNVIILADILEHLREPSIILEECIKLIAPGGFLIVSLPNIRYFPILWYILILGDFHYSESGVLDNTHIHFYCKKNMIELLDKSGFKVDIIRPALTKKKSIVNRVTCQIFEEFLSIQYVFQCSINKC